MKIEEVPSAKGGKMNTELKNAVLATDLKAQYDACAKKLLGYKDILARILIEAVEEFIFYVSLKAGRSKIIINVEAQRRETRLLGALLSETLREEEKLNILKNEYHIPMEKSIEEDVKVMCNLSEGIEERGIMKGRAEGRAEGKAEGREEGRTEHLKQQVQKKLVKGKSVEVIADELEERVSAIENVLEELRKNA